MLNRKSQVDTAFYAFLLILVLIVGIASLYYKEFYAIKSTRDVSNYYETVHLEQIVQDTKHIFGESSLSYSLMYASQDLSMHGGINPVLLEDRDNDGISDNDLKIKVQKDGEEFIPFWTVVENSVVQKRIPYEYEGYKEEEINVVRKGADDLLSFYLNNFQDKVAEYEWGNINVEIGEPKAKFLEGEEGFVKGEFVSENGIMAESKSGDELISKIVSAGYVEDEVEIRYWKLYEEGVYLVENNVIENGLLNNMQDIPDHWRLKSCSLCSCSPPPRPPPPSTGTIRSNLIDGLGDIEKELNNDFKNEGIVWKLELIGDIHYQSIPR